MTKTKFTFVSPKKMLGFIALACMGLFVFVGQVSAQTATNSWSGNTDLTPVDGLYDGTIGTMESQVVAIAGIPGGATIDDIEVDLGFDHTWVGDLTIKLEAPDGTILGLMSRPGLVEVADDGTDCCGDTADADLDAAMAPLTWLDAGAVSAEDMGSTLAGFGDIVGLDDGFFEYSPAPGSIATPPATFAEMAGMLPVDGSASNGDWIIHVGDGAFGDQGALRSITLRVSYTGGNGICDDVDFNLGSIANLNVTLGASCGAKVTPAMVLTGDQTCVDNAVVTIDGGNSDIMQGCGDHTYMVQAYDQYGALVYTGWGDIFAEDKADPTIDCAADTDEVTVDVTAQVILGALEATDPTIELLNYSCFLEIFLPVAGDHHYDLHTFTVNDPAGTGVFTIDMVSDWGDGSMALFEGAFNADNPCENIIGQGEDLINGSGFFSSFDPSFRMSAALRHGQTYTLMVSSWGSNTTGDYGIAIFGENGGSVNAGTTTTAPVTFDLICNDINSVELTGEHTYTVNADGSTVSGTMSSTLRAALDLTGYPTIADNCGPVSVTVSDVVTENGDCGDVFITRTFIVADRADGVCVGDPRTAECEQIISFRKPTQDDIQLPNFTTAIECDVDYPTDGAVGGPDDNPTAGVAGFPFIRTAFGSYNLDDSYCNVGASYSDEPRINVCEGTYKFRREWNIIDWCNPGAAIIYNQIIKVGDYTGPSFDIVIADYNNDGQADDVIRLSTSPFSCEANWVSTVASNVQDNCSTAGSGTITIVTDEGDFVWTGAEGILVPGLAIGDYEVTWCLEDACENETCETVDLIVRDEIEPTASCDDQLNVSIGGGDVHNGVEGIARIYAEDVDEGSSDNCGEVTLEVRRNYWRNNTCNASENRWSAWGDYVDFYCCDINNEITLELRVTDESGNTNMCWMVITPEDKLVPYCYPPLPVTLSCAALPLTFPGDIEAAYDEDFEGTSQMMDDLFGYAWGTDNCAVDAIVERTPNIQINDCGWGTIQRRFEVWQWRPEGDLNGNGELDRNEAWVSTNSCSQLITITETHDFVIDFPEDADAECGDPEIATIITEAEGCDILAVNIGDPVRFSATGDECYKLSITYDVINWCLWDGEYTGYVLPRMTEDDGEALPVDRAVEGNERPVVRYTSAAGLCVDRRHSDRDGDSSLDNCFSPQLSNYGRYIYTQFVKVYDATAPVVTVDEFGGATDLCPTLEAGQFGDPYGVCEAAVSLPFSVSDECELFDGNGDLVISLVSATVHEFSVDANGDGVIKSNELSAGVNVSVTDNGDGTYKYSGTHPIITNAMGEGVYHALHVLLEDGCGNQVSEIIAFDVIDCKGPAPICINGLTVTLMPQEEGGCAMAIWASDFEGSPIYDCTGQGPEVDPTSGLPRVTKYAVYRATEASEPGFVPVPTHTGVVFNEDDAAVGQVIVYVYGFDEDGNYDYCETYVLVQQHVDCGTGGGTLAGVIMTEGSETVEGVEVSLSGSEAMSFTTNNDGSYSFADLAAGGDYSVTPFLNAEPLNGVSTFDLVLMSKHILGVQLLDSPYKLIAADVNNSETISTLDMIKLRRLILNLDTEFAANTSWRFIPAGYDFPVSTNPWFNEFPEVANFNNLVEGTTAADFVGVKIGDVNGSAAANLLSSDDRTLNGQFNFEVENVTLKAGNTYTVPFTGADMASVEGYQATLALAGAELVDVEYGVAEANNFGLRFANEGMITTSWNGEATSEDVLFSLVIRATADAQLSDVVKVSSRYTAAEAYANGTTANVAINFSTGEVVAAGFELYQNTPNPFAAETMIGFNLPADAKASITISDASGRVLTVIRKDFSAGYNTQAITKAMVNGATGVLSYTVTAGDFTATKSMIAVK